MKGKLKIYCMILLLSCLPIIGIYRVVNGSSGDIAGIPIPTLQSAVFTAHIAAHSAHGSNGNILGKGDADALYTALSSTSTTTITTPLLSITGNVSASGVTTSGTITAVGLYNSGTSTVGGLYTGGTVSANIVSSATYSVNHAVCFKASGVLGYCSTVVSASGTCTCN